MPLQATGERGAAGVAAMNIRNHYKDCERILCRV